MVAHAQAELPNECCGVLAGRLEVQGSSQADGAEAVPIGDVIRHYPLSNDLASPTEYYSAPFGPHKDMRKEGLELLAIYHSHPQTDPVPSQKDIERNYYGSEVVHFIISMKDGEPRMRGWRLRESDFEEADWTLTEAN
jgi:proteasome lid subunit RPN8/RPN11